MSIYEERFKMGWMNIHLTEQKMYVTPGARVAAAGVTERMCI